MISKQCSLLQPLYVKEHSSSYLQHPQWCVLHPILHTQWIAYFISSHVWHSLPSLAATFGAGRRLIAITIILPFLMCRRNVQMGDAVSATVGSHVVAQTVELCATRGGRQFAWMHTTRGHFMMEQLQVKCAQWVTVHHRKQREVFVGFCNFLLTCPFW